jgi:hypothetical protein
MAEESVTTLTPVPDSNGVHTNRDPTTFTPESRHVIVFEKDIKDRRRKMVVGAISHDNLDGTLSCS